jgi:hypothetical protein
MNVHDYCSFFTRFYTKFAKIHNILKVKSNLSLLRKGAEIFDFFKSDIPLSFIYILVDIDELYPNICRFSLKDVG